MDDKSLTPEERLLKLIKDSSKPDKEARPVNQPVPEGATPTQQKKTADEPKQAALKLRLDFKNFFTITNLNKLFLTLFLFVLLYAIGDLAVFVMPRMFKMATKQELDLSGTKKAAPGKYENISLDTQPLNYYTDQIEKKDLFKSIIAAKESDLESRTQSSLVKNRIDEIAKTFVLKGIIAGEPPQAVIEDTKLAKTYFVTKGEKIGNTLIEEITDNKVKLNVEGQSLDLTL